MYAILQISKIKDENLVYADNDSAGRIRWANEYDDFVSKAPVVVKESIIKFNNSSNHKEKFDAKKRILSCGMYAIPFIREETKKGNIEIIGIMPEILEAPAQCLEYNNSYWLKWLSDNESIINDFIIGK
ncbi:MAG: hypothetical protein EHM85_19375 [Desulfobacteraceae bacterium]|nr:MAG: hypothetical protein EHM85_19375 [Desulfobacteraceae bacterium]